MAHWKGHERHFPNESDLVAEFTFTHSDLDLLTAFYQEVTSPGEVATLSVGDLIEASRLFAMIADAADWTDLNEDEEIYDDR